MTGIFTVHAGMIGLLFFFIFFLSMLVWVFRPGAKKRYQDYAQIPLKEGENNDRG